MANSINLAEKRIVVTGGAGFLGKAVCQVLRERGVPDTQILVPRRSDYDLIHEANVIRMYDDFQPDVVIHLAAEVGGIGANMAQPGRFFYANMAMGMHLVEEARRRQLSKFVHTGTVCAYPKFCEVPFREEDLWDGYPEETNAPYGVAKKAIFVMLDGYRRQYGLPSAVVVPVNLYGPGDNFDPSTSHVIPALIRKCEDARQANAPSITCWGTGEASRQFLHVADAAEGIVRAAEVMDDPVPINLGGGEEILIRELVSRVAQACGYLGKVEWDATKPDGQPRRSIAIVRANSLLEWSPRRLFVDGLAQTIEWWRANRSSSDFALQREAYANLSSAA
ncbi:MAG: GDP-L-fucose synthase [Planctomycetota bacterium]|nr:GDP-L-fucose synthase [Planctomycetota bacterium]